MSASDVVGIAPADRDLLRVEVLEQRLGELTRCSEFVAKLRQSDRAAALLRQGDDPPLRLIEHVAVVVQRPRHANHAARSPQRGQIGAVKLGVQGRSEAGIEEALFKRELGGRQWQ